jgi:putative phosphoesterase
MKIAALADIHGNYQALMAAVDQVERWKPDLVLVLGDTINRGPRSRECLEKIQEKESGSSWKVIRGNHEGYVLSFTDPDFPRSGPEFEMRRVIFWTYQSLGTRQIEDVSKQPDRLSISLPDGKLLSGYHASTAGDRVGIYPDSTAKELEKLVDQKADLFLVGHTHQPLIRSFQGSTVINVGSVGLPFDGDRRGAYAQISCEGDLYRAEIIRFEYDLEAACGDFERSGFLAEGGPLAELVLEELKLGWPQLNHWFRRYENRVLQHQISLPEAAAEYMLTPNIEYRRKGTDGFL